MHYHNSPESFGVKLVLGCACVVDKGTSTT